MKDWVEKLKPKGMIKVFDAYMQVRDLQKGNPDIKLPLIELSLSNAVVYTGTILHCDFDKNMLSILIAGDRHKNAVSFITFGNIRSITFHNIDLCNEFIDKLESI